MNKFNNFKNFITGRGEIVITTGVVVISLVILYSYFLSSNETSRDAIRYTNLLKINDDLKLYYSKNNTYPLPDDSVNITASGEILTYQGNAGEDVFKSLGTELIKDPKSYKLFNYLNYFTYATDEKKQKFQLMTFYEGDPENKYEPTTNRKPINYGDKIGIAIENNTSRPIQETKLGLDILNTLDSYSIYLDEKNILVGDKLNLKQLISNTEKSQAVSCLEIKNSGLNISGNYFINPLLESDLKIPKKPLKVYCDMESDGGGWTRLYFKKGKETCFNDDNFYNPFIIEKVITKDFAISDNIETLKSEGSWILKDIDLKNEGYNTRKMANIANCKTPMGTKWSNEYDGGYVSIRGTLSTMGTWTKMFSGCEFYKNVGEKLVVFNIGGMKDYNMTGEFIHTLCNNYSEKDNSITSKWDWDNTRVIWVR
ncbi:MAG: fibrinogen-like YCDxxxxGGGW domain-containing protein [Candidatus Gracilibacteria bacterium]|nr:fibrinogen-like YCDxxxxGGGW domain-containing protein [Candidatus Gracilibacteria bacterium]